MKYMGEEVSRVVVFSKEQCRDLLEDIENIHPLRWARRTKINSLPTQGDPTSDYFFLGDRQQEKEFNKKLRAMAPVYPGLELSQACINRYDPGQYMPEHIDWSTNRVNMVVALNEDGDGVEIKGVFSPDVQGEAVVFYDKSPPHRVPPVKNQRYVVIYLYT